MKNLPPLNLTKEVWVELLSDGGSVLLKDASQPICLCFTEGSDAPNISDGFVLEPHQTRKILGFTNVPAGTKLWICAADGAATVRVAK